MGVVGLESGEVTGRRAEERRRPRPGGTSLVAKTRVRCKEAGGRAPVGVCGWCREKAGVVWGRASRGGRVEEATVGVLVMR